MWEGSRPRAHHLLANQTASDAVARAINQASKPNASGGEQPWLEQLHHHTRRLRLTNQQALHLTQRFQVAASGHQQLQVVAGRGHQLNGGCWPGVCRGRRCRLWSRL